MMFVGAPLLAALIDHGQSRARSFVLTDSSLLHMLVVINHGSSATAPNFSAIAVSFLSRQASDRA